MARRASISLLLFRPRREQAGAKHAFAEID
jgi:hypothetical protein